MRRFLAALIALSLAPALARAGDGWNLYGADGSYQGRISRDGNIFGPDGSYRGRISGFDDASGDSARRSRRPPP